MATVRSPRPLWRWWLFCGALRLWGWAQWRWLASVYGWAALPVWVGFNADDSGAADNDAPPF